MFFTTAKQFDQDWLIGTTSKYDSPKLGFTAGANILISISKRFSFETGVLYSDKGLKEKIDYSIFTTPYGQQIDPSIPKLITSKYHFNYLVVPLKFKFNIINRKAKLFLSLGASPDFFLNVNIKSIYEYWDGHTTKIVTSPTSTSIRKFNVAVIAGIGFSYDASKRISFKLEPTYSRFVTPLQKTDYRYPSYTKSYFYSAGCEVGLYYKL